MATLNGNRHEAPADADANSLPLLPSSPPDLEAARCAGDSQVVDNGAAVDIQNEDNHPRKNVIARVPSDTKADLELRKAIEDNDLPTVQKLLAEGVSTTRCVRGSTPLHDCFSNNRCVSVKFNDDKSVLENHNENKMAIIEELLKKITQTSNTNSILDYPDSHGNTCLHYAIQQGHLKAVEALIKAGAGVECLNNNKESALHLTASQNDHTMLKYLLEEEFPVIKYLADINGAYPLHCAVAYNNVKAVKLILEKFKAEILDKVNNNGSTVWHIIAEKNSVDIARYLLSNIACEQYSCINQLSKDIIKTLDKDGRTPVHIAASKGYEEMTMLLLLKGEGVLSIKDEKTTVVEEILSEFADPQIFFEDLFNNWIRNAFNADKAGVDFKGLTDCSGMGQINVIEKLASCDHGALLKHPMIESLIYFKWKCISPVVYVTLIFYMIFLSVFNVFVVYTFAKIDDVKDMDSEFVNTTALTTEVTCERPYWILIGLVYWSIGVLFTLECIWLYVEKYKYLKRRESWMGLCVLALACAVPPAVGCAAHAHLSWQRHFTCFTVLLTWLQALLLLAQNPDWAYYYAFERAVKKILKISVTAICLLFGFSICFLVQYQSQPPFDGFGAAVTKTVMMMTSEFEYEGLMEQFSNQTLLNTATAAQFNVSQIVIRIVFVIFVILVAITLMNFMVGIAVNDIKKLHKSGDIRRLEEQVEILNILKGLGDTVFGKCWAGFSHVQRQVKMYRGLRDPGFTWNICLSESDDKDGRKEVEQTFPAELHKSIYNIAKKKQRDKLNELYEAVVGKAQEFTSQNENNNKKSSVITLKDRMKTLEDANADIKQTIDSVMNVVCEILQCVEKRDK